MDLSIKNLLLTTLVFSSLLTVSCVPTEETARENQEISTPKTEAIEQLNEEDASQENSETAAEINENETDFIDGKIDDWPYFHTVKTDEYNDVTGSPDSKEGLDLKSIHTYMDEHYLYVAIQVFGDFPIQQTRNYFVTLDYDGDRKGEYHFGFRTDTTSWVFDHTFDKDNWIAEGTKGVLAQAGTDTVEISIPRDKYEIPDYLRISCRVTDGNETLDSISSIEIFPFSIEFKDSDRDGLIDPVDPEPAEEVEYEVAVDYLSEDMIKDALSCINPEDKVETFKKLSQIVFNHVPHAMHPRGINEYPNPLSLHLPDDELLYPRDPLSYYYSQHDKVIVPPVCNDIAFVYDIMADYIIEYTGWDEEGESQGSSGVDCDSFPCNFDNTTHIVCIVNINGDEYVAEAVYGTLFELNDNPHYDFNLKNIISWREPSRVLIWKFDKRYGNTIYDRNPIGIYFDEYTLWEMLRNQTPENEIKLQELFSQWKATIKF